LIKAITPAPLRLKATSAGTVDNVGTETTATLATGNIDMWRHPKYYKELRKLRNNSDQAISKESSTEENQRAPDSGQTKKATSSKSQATSNKHKSQATSSKQQANED